MQNTPATRWRCACRHPHGTLPCRVPPSPEVMAEIFMEYRNSAQAKRMSFGKYLRYIGFVNPAADVVGMDDAARFVPTAAGPQLLAIPQQRVVGELQLMVLLVDFADRRGVKPVQHYRDMLFSQGVFPSGSLRDYYQEVSGGKVNVTGSVHGWLTMPQPYSHYTNGQSGLEWASYPRNAPRLAEDAVNAAVAAGVPFSPALDKFGQGVVTALFIVHAGRGAEVMPKALQGGEIWSHKWQFRNPVSLPGGLSTTVYLAVPNDCKVGVCAHELGHLAFQWQDFYDPNYDEDGMEWDGTGVWDLMAGGSYNGDGARPAHPAALHKLQHGWISATKVTTSTSLSLKPFAANGARVAKVVSPKYKPGQYLLLENRARKGFDFDLPGPGLLVWKVDETSEQFSPLAPGLSLVQADGQGDLDAPDDWNQGDAADPFPGSEGKTKLGDSGPVSTSFAGQRSGVSLKNIRLDAQGGVKLDVVFAAVPGGSPAAKKSTAAKKAVAAKKVAATKKMPAAKKAPALKKRAARKTGAARKSRP